MSCMIVCPAACHSCDIAPCADRMADEDSERRLHIAAAQAAGMTGTELTEFWDGRKGGKGTTIPRIYEDKTLDIKEAEGLKHCGMRSDLSCRHCHETTCKIRKADRTF